MTEDQKIFDFYPHTPVRLPEREPIRFTGDNFLSLGIGAMIVSTAFLWGFMTKVSNNEDKGKSR